MTIDEKRKFDNMNNTSYLLRLLLEQHEFVIQPININNDCIYHILKNGHTVGTLVTRYDSDLNYSYNNIRLYKYFKEKFPKANNFMMSEYWILEDHKIVKFNFDLFNKWCVIISEYVNQLGTRESNKDNIETFNDTLNRLSELVSEYDEKFTSNALIKDINKLLVENERLNNELNKRKTNMLDLYTRIKL